MLTLIEAINFRCLRYVRQPLEPFHVLVGPNASGKTTFLDVVAFLGRLVSRGPEAAVEERTGNFHDLTWNRSQEQFELAIEARIPETRREKIEESFDALRYEVVCGVDPKTQEFGIIAESLHLRGSSEDPRQGLLRFPRNLEPPSSLMTKKGVKNIRRVIAKVPGGNDNFYSESHKEKGKGWFPSIKLGHRRSALGNLPHDEEAFPVATWFSELLTQGVQSITLNSLLIRKASPPGHTRGFRPDGSNLPWVIADLEKKHPEQFAKWIAHLRTALPNLEGIRTVEREDDRHRYLMLRYRGGLEVPSWVASDGTLRLLALTLPAYLSDLRGVYLIEEPENGIHPSAVETVYQSLSSVYDAQILLATHSPVILSLARASDVLCFAKTEEGATDIVRGSEHPALREWKGTPNLGLLLGSGVLG
ncbi:methylation-associated defense system AAA family ATPase MAD3 [Chondromyces crocatus]|uniref:ATPase-like protein n=1 Tax=Chondromyces crocatus TaxID=52 RepID=A0A0K1E8P4_CHOCO|nr:ATP-binding protein [Chondromyces crocatus]AKT36953.1 ATPase-like protein [Chondromyces crocatus]